MIRRVLAFGTLCVILTTIGWVYLARGRPIPGAGSDHDPNAPAELERIRSRPHLVFRNTRQRDGYGRVALAALDAPNERLVTDLVCERVYFAGGQGLCLAADRGVLSTYSAHVIDENLTLGQAIPLTGPPSRARVSPDGRYAAFTVFESGHSYSGDSFSTRTTLLDTRSAAPLGNLEHWEIERDGAPFRETDFNLWGVTFAPDGDRIYATLATGGRNFLVEGDLSTRRLRVLREGVECPSLSPDGRRIVFKSRRIQQYRVVWRLHVLDLVSGVETPLDGEQRSVDDQADWLDDGHVLYALPPLAAAKDRVESIGGEDIWVMEARAGAAPHKLLEQASSPAVVR